MNRYFSVLLVGALLAGCSEVVEEPDTDPVAQSWTLEDTTLFPADRSLARPEDGVILPDGRLIVADLRYGLAELGEDGVATPFGDFASAGFVSEEGPDKGGPNGVHLSADGGHILTAEIFTGAIYRTDVENETTEKVYQHSATVNTAISDSTGAVWFTQSTNGLGEERMFAAVDKAMSDGAVYRLARAEDGTYASEPELLVDGLDFANGFYLDEKRGRLFLSETVAGRVLSFPLDVEQGTLGESEVLANLPSPDNIRMVKNGRLWVASPLSNRVFAVDPDTGDKRIVFDALTDDGREVLAEWNRRGEKREPRLDLLTPEHYGELPGLITGLIVDQQGQPVFVTGLGDALVRLNR